MRADTIESREARLGRRLVAPAVGIVLLVAVFPLADTVWESLHVHDLRMPWRGRPFVGLQNYAEALGSSRFLGALGHTLAFSAVSVTIELVLGLLIALAMDRAWRARGLVRVGVLLPWAIPTVVSALLWQFLFDARSGIADAFLEKAGLLHGPFVWFVHPLLAWVPIVLADVWKTTPFVALILLAGLQTIPREVTEAAKVDGAGPVRRFFFVTLPMLRPALVVALLFRFLDAFRVFDLVYVMTGGGPGTATEPVSLTTFDSLLQDLRFGYGSALAVLVFLVTAVVAFVVVRFLGPARVGGER